MLPPFEIDCELPLALARGVALVGLFSVFGSVLARVATMPPALARLSPDEVQHVERRWRLLVWTSFVVATAGLGVWTWLVAGYFYPLLFVRLRAKLYVVLATVVLVQVVDIGRISRPGLKA
jgi:hypothetical protein